MAEYCSNCAGTVGFRPDIEIAPLALTLRCGCSKTFLCEGCNVRGLYKDDSGTLFLLKLVNEEYEFEEVEYKWNNISPFTLVAKMKRKIWGHSN